MKKALIILLALFFIAGAAFSEVSKMKVNVTPKIGYFNPSENQIDNSLMGGIELRYDLKTIGKLAFEYDYSAADIKGATDDVKFHLINLNYLLPLEKDAVIGSFYLGGGIGYVKAKAPGEDLSKVGANIILGYKAPAGIIGEVRYTAAGSDKDSGGGNVKMSGLAIMIGYTFK